MTAARKRAVKPKIGFQLQEVFEGVPQDWKKAKVAVKTMNGIRLARNFKCVKSDEGHLVVIFDAEPFVPRHQPSP